MYTQFFGNYLVREKVITNEQLLKALELHASNYENGNTFYLFPDQSTAKQKPSLFMLLGQTLVDHKILTPQQFQQHMQRYCSQCRIPDLNTELETDFFHKLLTDMLPLGSGIPISYIADYLQLLLHNLIQSVGKDFSPMSILPIERLSTGNCVFQELECPLFHIASALNMDSPAAIAFASRYMEEEVQSLNEYVKASMADFLNIHNGLYMTNMSNEYDLRMRLNPTENKDFQTLAPGKNTFLLPFLFPFGMVHFLCSVRAVE